LSDVSANFYPDIDKTDKKNYKSFQCNTFRQFRKSPRTIRVVHVVVVQVPVVAVEDPSVVNVVPLDEPTVRAGVGRHYDVAIAGLP
jgi:hypothetical protein